MASEAGFIWQPDPQPGIKTRLSPAAFPTTHTLSSFSPFPLSSYDPRRAYELHLSPACPFPFPKRYDEAREEKCLSMTARFDSLDAPPPGGSILLSTVR